MPSGGNQQRGFMCVPIFFTRLRCALDIKIELVPTSFQCFQVSFLTPFSSGLSPSPPFLPLPALPHSPPSRPHSVASSFLSTHLQDKIHSFEHSMWGTSLTFCSSNFISSHPLFQLYPKAITSPSCHALVGTAGMHPLVDLDNPALLQSFQCRGL